MRKRYLFKEISEDLKNKMVFLGGPRQVGKTTFARSIIGPSYKHPAYYIWDDKSDRRDILNSAWSAEADLIILDEIHKYKKWKTFIKGLYYKHKNDYAVMVTGSSRLDIYRKGGDSLQGRYHYYRLHPFSLAEAIGQTNHLTPAVPLEFYAKKESGRALKDLLAYGGFPEPFIAQDEKTLRRWHNERIERMFREDIRDTEIIRDMGSMELLGSLLPEKVASLLSINSLREDLEVSYRAAANWVALLERFYYHFRIYPFAAKRIRSLKKEPKLYLWDWSEVEDAPKRFENLMAGHLLKLAHYLHDAEGYDLNLHFLRDVDGREVDFLITLKQKPWFAVEVKNQGTKISKNLLYFGKRLNIPYLYQVVLTSGIDKQIGDVRLISADKFLGGLI